MVTVSLSLDDELNAALESVCTGQGRDKATLLTDLVRRYVENEKLKTALQDPELARLYQQLAAEDVCWIAGESLQTRPCRESNRRSG